MIRQNLQKCGGRHDTVTDTSIFSLMCTFTLLLYVPLVESSSERPQDLELHIDS
jgi:hypothetical protein